MANLSPYLEERQAFIKRAPALVRQSYRYDAGRRCWIASSWSTPDQEYPIYATVSGTILVTSCACQAGSRGLLCSHALGFAETVLRERYPGVQVSEHRAAKPGEDRIRVAARKATI